MPESYLTGMDLFYGTAGPIGFRSVVYPMAPTIEFITGMNATNTDAKSVGVAKSTVIFGPSQAAALQRRTITYEGQYRLLNHARGKAIDDGDEKSVIGYDTTPEQSASEDKAVLKRFDCPVVRMVERERIMKVWHRDRDRALLNSGGDKQRANEAVQGVFNIETRDTQAVMMEGFEAMLFGIHPSYPTGAPTDTALNEWDCLYSFANMIDSSNTYLGVNRALAANKYFRGYKVTAARAAVLEDLLWEMQHSGSLRTGGYTNLVICGERNFQKFWTQAETKGYRMISNDKVPDKMTFGAKNQVIEYQFNSRPVYVLCDPQCPEYDANGVLITDPVNQTFSYGHVYTLRTDSFTTIFRGGYNFAKTPWVDQSDRPGSDKADVAFLKTHMQLICEIPAHNGCFMHCG
jgi:hypothetical protein